MNILILNGSLDQRTGSTPAKLSAYLKQHLEDQGSQATVFNLVESGIPLFDYTLQKVPNGVQVMLNLFRTADAHIWLTPLYHGSMTGVMKNCLDWLELSSKEERPYLIDKLIGMVCWADGGQAMQGINAMDAVAKSLRAWPVPFSVPIVRNALFEAPGYQEITQEYKNKINLLTNIITSKRVVTI
ncbi:NADPH-dependent FMN reductase [Niabella aurantiaca]|uniref:NADPH-dependent FMN reductase n=1 Tax=Niabella aurantiaca TaxID=379900 RepID=UPI00037E8C11|nr:NADPH-dependent FMN reductase [Niabella aurantiaca]